ncbi:hypothetical protein [uncultured Enterovirga sp.]|uniref:hypothetical protein n=1 Tax=uncultured Enterovirga sp. TaxID=2026352 RepID=UPI0035CC7AE9
MFGPVRIFTPAHGSIVAIEGNALRVRQTDRSDVLLDPEGGIRMRLALPERERGTMYMGAVIQEQVGAVLTAAIAYAVWLLDRVDPTMRLTHSAIAVTLSNAESATWRTQQEQDASPNSISMRGFGRDPQPVMLAPPVLPRPALRTEPNRLVEDLLTLMRREWRAR